MQGARWIAIVLGLTIVVAALVGWRGSRPTSPTAAARSDGVTVVPATATLRRVDALPTPLPSAAAATVLPTIPPLDPDTAATLPDRFAVQSRDPAWVPQTEVSARTAVADVPHLAGPMVARCAATLCRMTGAVADGVALDQVDDAMQALQTRAMDRMVRQGPFRDGSMTFMTDPQHHRTVTVWLVRR